MVSNLHIFHVNMCSTFLREYAIENSAFDASDQGAPVDVFDVNGHRQSAAAAISCAKEE
jgi:hypothetical protein